MTKLSALGFTSPPRAGYLWPDHNPVCMSDVSPVNDAMGSGPSDRPAGRIPVEVGATPAVKPFRTVGIVGAGPQGARVAHWCVLSGFGVILCDHHKEVIQRGVAVIRELFAEGVRQGSLSSAEAHKLTGGIGITTSLEDFEICDLVIEAITEDLAAKQAVFEELSARVDPDCVLASASATLSLNDIAARTSRPGRVVGLHFPERLEPQATLKIIAGPETSRTTIERMSGLAKTSGLVPTVF